MAIDWGRFDGSDPQNSSFGDTEVIPLTPEGQPLNQQCQSQMIIVVVAAGTMTTTTTTAGGD
jgi:hypothetical protein